MCMLKLRSQFHLLVENEGTKQMENRGRSSLGPVKRAARLHVKDKILSKC